MRATISALTIASALICASAFAGTETYKTTATPAPSECGTGFYVALDGGANLYQDFGGDKQFGFAGQTFELGAHEHTGGFGGIKFGYIFGNGAFRFGLEEDLYYNGVEAGAFVRTANNNVEIAHGNAQLNTAAFMTNLILKWAPNGGCGFQPYILGGVGGWWGETGGDIDITVGNQTHSFGSRDNGGFAFQLGAGTDYYFSPKWAVFVEYKFLDYTNAGNEFTNSNIGQHLVGGGVKFHF